CAVPTACAAHTGTRRTEGRASAARFRPRRETPRLRSARSWFSRQIQCFPTDHWLPTPAFSPSAAEHRDRDRVNLHSPGKNKNKKKIKIESAALVMIAAD